MPEEQPPRIERGGKRRQLQRPANCTASVHQFEVVFVGILKQSKASIAYKPKH